MQMIYVIIINFKTEDVIKDAIKSLEEEEVDIHIVVLDNGSTESSFKVLEEITDNRVELISSDTNLGFAGGVNYTAEYIKNKYKKPEYFFLFNPDALSTKNLVGTLCNVLSSNNKVAAISPHILTMDNKSWFSGGMIDWEKCEILNNPEVANSTEIRKVDVYNGCAALINAEKFFEAGMLESDLFIYFDEAFLSMNFLDMGYQCYYHPRLIAYHHVSYGISSESTLKTYYMTRNQIFFFKKYSKKKFLFSLHIEIFKTLLSDLKHFRVSHIHYVLLAVYDAIRGEKGKF